MLRSTVLCMRIKSTLILWCRYTHRGEGRGRNAKGLSILRAVLFGRQGYLTVEGKTEFWHWVRSLTDLFAWVRSHINCLAVAENCYSSNQFPLYLAKRQLSEFDVAFTIPQPQFIKGHFRVPITHFATGPQSKVWPVGWLPVKFARR